MASMELPDPSDYTSYANYEEAMAAIAETMEEPWPWNMWQRMTALLKEAYPDESRDNKMIAAKVAILAYSM